MEKDHRYTVRLPKKVADILEKHCSEQNIPIAEFMRAATEKALPKTWNPTDEYDLTHEPGQGYSQTKGNWSPEVIRSYADKVKVRQTSK